jgi:hypothetical protein
MLTDGYIHIGIYHLQRERWTRPAALPSPTCSSAEGNASMPLAKFTWTAVTWAIGLGPLSLMSHGLPLHASKWLIGTHIQRERGVPHQQGDEDRWQRAGARQIE